MSKYFSIQELQCPCCGRSNMQSSFLEKLDALREDCNFPFVISSAYRCEEHNKAVGGKSGSAHMQGRAVDIVCYGSRAFDVVRKAAKHGMTGIGVEQSGPHEKRFIHIDDTDGETRPWCWSY